eukprot:7272314-Pyramimonas_sp.AAC.1
MRARRSFNSADNIPSQARPCSSAHLPPLRETCISESKGLGARQLKRALIEGQKNIPQPEDWGWPGASSRATEKKIACVLNQQLAPADTAAPLGS